MHVRAPLLTAQKEHIQWNQERVEEGKLKFDYDYTPNDLCIHNVPDAYHYIYASADVRARAALVMFFARPLSLSPGALQLGLFSPATGAAAALAMCSCTQPIAAAAPALLSRRHVALQCVRVSALCVAWQFLDSPFRHLFKKDEYSKGGKAALALFVRSPFFAISCAAVSMYRACIRSINVP